MKLKGQVFFISSRNGLFANSAILCRGYRCSEVVSYDQDTKALEALCGKGDSFYWTILIAQFINWYEKVFFSRCGGRLLPKQNSSVFSWVTVGTAAASVAGVFLWNTAYWPAHGI